ncbi:MAG TPA: DUF4157 domain-containing protein [Thermoanaerobaculia bacterium]|jgi:hypothetical protein|nr:DUF4157 domain-containing protein [Thermoanaerobaculia bacterium]
MQAFMPKAKRIPQAAATVKTPLPGRAGLGPQAEPGLSEESTRGHDFNRISIYSSAPAGIQPKLTVSTPGDIYEQEADRVADTVMRGPADGTPRVAFDEGIPTMRGAGRPLTSSERNFMEPRFGADFSAVRLHMNQEADSRSRALQARAFTLGNDIFFRAGEYTPGKAESHHLLAHELTHTIQQGAAGPLGGRSVVQGKCPPTVQREMKFEFQTKNEIFRNDGTRAEKLERKYGPKDFLVKGNSGVTLESETNGVLEFETKWQRKWSKLEEQIKEAFDMTQAMNAANPVASGRQEFPFDVSGLRTGTKKELKRGKWSPKPGMEGGAEKILATGENLEVDIKDSAWNAGIQSSEGFALDQYESFLKQHEFPDYREPVIANAEAILNKANTGAIDASRLVNLRNFLEIIVNYIKRGEGGPASDAAGAFESVKDMPSKQAFTLMSRTNFASMYAKLLSPVEKKMFNSIVSGGIILTEMGLTTASPFFVEGYGTDSPQTGPTVHKWLKGITKGRDLLAHGTGPGLSAAMGRYRVQTKAGQKDTKLVKFETRNRPVAAGGAFRDASDWVDFAHDLFKEAIRLRPRTDKTSLEDS